MSDYSSLRQEGLRSLERMAGSSWTDFNVHDPGISILEQLCYALTDLGYRSEHELPDLLAREGRDAYASLFTPAAILPSGPITIEDLRKLVIDVPGVKNAWIEIADDAVASHDAARGGVSYLAPPVDRPSLAPRNPNVSEIRPAGLYRVQIEKSDLVDIDGTDIRRAAAKRLHQFRGLGVDYTSIDVLKYQDVQIETALEIGPVGDATELLAAVYQRIAEYCSPSVTFHTLAEMLDRGRRVDQIFEGPLLDHGFIDADELATIERRTELRVSDLIHVLTAIPGVLAVKKLHFVINEQPSPDWLLSVERDHTPRFDSRRSSIRLERRSLRVDSDGLSRAAHAVFVARATRAARPDKAQEPDGELRPRPGRDRQLGTYHSVQRQFPMTYGIGSAGLPRSASPERRAQARQLKAYVLFYDQLLANYFAQLANVGTLLSFHDETPTSYFSQPVEDGPDGDLDLDAVRNTGASHAAALRQITEDPWGAGTAAEESGLRRRNRMLDHLLARVGEQFGDYALLQGGSAAGGGVASAAALANDKRAFLRDYPRIGRDRGVGFDCLAPAVVGSSIVLPGDCLDPVGLAGKLTAAADAMSAFVWGQSRPAEQQLLADTNAPRADKDAAIVALLNRVVHGGVSAYAEDRVAGLTLSPETQQLLAQVPAVAGVRLARLNRLLLEDAYSAEIARSRDEHNLSGLELVLRRKLGVRTPEERFHLVEHILLRPIDGDSHQRGPLFGDAALRDPYSLQVTLVFPKWSGKYVDENFRQFVEETVHEQAPAHLTAYVRWLDRPAMEAFEAAYGVWLHEWRNHRLLDLGL